jgi:hypothetical protein
MNDILASACMAVSWQLSNVLDISLTKLAPLIETANQDALLRRSKKSAGGSATRGW